MKRTRAKKSTSTHHRKSRFLGGTDTPRNLSRVPSNKHQAWHLLFMHGDPQYVVEQINEIWLDTDFILILQKRRMK